jgi:hypothetical protein
LRWKRNGDGVSLRGKGRKSELHAGFVVQHVLDTYRDPGPTGYLASLAEGAPATLTADKLWRGPSVACRAGPVGGRAGARGNSTGSLCVRQSVGVELVVSVSARCWDVSHLCGPMVVLEAIDDHDALTMPFV